MKLIIACVCFLLAALCLAEICRSEVDGNSGLHFGVSAGLGFMAGVATQNIERPWLRRTVAGVACMIPGVLKEATDPKWSWADIGFDGAGCGTGYGSFWGLNVYLSPNSIHVAGKFD